MFILSQKKSHEKLHLFRLWGAKSRAADIGLFKLCGHLHTHLMCLIMRVQWHSVQKVKLKF